MRIESSDRDSGVKRLDFRVGSGPWQVAYPGFADVPITEEGQYAVEYRAIDRAGNETSLRSHGVRVDKTDPVVTIDPSITGARVEVGNPLAAAFTCDDALFGVLTCQGMLPQGEPLPTDAEGTFEFWVAAIDNAGNLTRETVQYTVVAADPGGGGRDPGENPGRDPEQKPGRGGASPSSRPDDRGLVATGAEPLGWAAGIAGLIAAAGAAGLIGARRRRGNGG